LISNSYLIRQSIKGFRCESGIKANLKLLLQSHKKTVLCTVKFSSMEPRTPEEIILQRIQPRSPVGLKHTKIYLLQILNYVFRLIQD